MTERLLELLDKQTELVNQLGESLKIQDIWKDAFVTGLPVFFGGMTKMLPNDFKRRFGFTSAYLRCEDGRHFKLSKEQVLKLKPNALIHPDFE